MLVVQKDFVLLAVKDGTWRKLLLATPETDTADVRLHLCFILIYIACSLKFGKGALECTEFVVTKCRAILTNPRSAIMYNAGSPEAGTTTTGKTTAEAGTYPYCGDVETEYSYGGCHTSCKSCIETYTRNGFTVGPVANSAGFDHKDDYSYGNAKNCYECHDGYYQIPAIAIYSTDKIGGYCKGTLILYAHINFLRMRSRCC